MNNFFRDVRRTVGVLLLVAVASASKALAVAAENPDESQAIRKIELLGGVVVQDDKSSGHSVTTIRFRSGTKFADQYVHLLSAFKNLEQLDLGFARSPTLARRTSGISKT